jgi:hypothetical protein
MKKIKITEAQFNEFIDRDGSLVSGDKVENDSQIKTNQYKDSGRPETTDDFADSTGQPDSLFWAGGGFSVSESKLTEEYMEESRTSIPDYTELSKSYESPQIQHNLAELTRNLGSLGNNADDIKAIVLKELLKVVDIHSLKNSHQQEIKNMI